ncbi:hypothetical protein [Paraburkholderia sp. RL17-373-BIF-A]|uniref:hypothetical protein n=1 Tax=Paraburkholderia sp. RL17-373-BIF-A TaxID=3031629 RepID=UPI0038BA7C14
MDARVRKVGHPMPEVATFTSAMRNAFGDECVDDAVRRGKAGEPTFYARENGRTVGTASPANDNVWRVNADIRDRHYCPGCDGGCVGQAIGCKEWLQRTASKEKP